MDGRKNKDEDEGNTHSASSDEDEVGVKRITNSRIQPAKFVAHAHRSGTRGGTKRTPRYQVPVVVKATPITVFADTGADVRVISASLAAELNP